MTLFSIVVCTQNGALTLLETLLSIVRLKKSSDIDFELIIIDNGSSDNTISIAERFLKEHIKQISIEIYVENNVGKSNAIHLAVTKARYDFILLCDDDNILFDDYLIESEKIIKQFPFIGIIGGYSDLNFKDYSTPKWFNRYRHLYSVGHQGIKSNSDLSEVVNIWGAGMIFRKEIYRWIISKKFNLYSGKTQYGVYLAGEDYELCLISKVLGFKNYYSSKLKILHNVNPLRLKWSSTKSLVIRNSLISVYLSIYYTFIIEANRSTTSNYFNRHLLTLFYKSLIRLGVSSVKHIIGFIMNFSEGYSYQLVFKLAIAELRLILNIYQDRYCVLNDLVYKKRIIDLISFE